MTFNKSFNVRHLDFFEVVIEDVLAIFYILFVFYEEIRLKSRFWSTYIRGESKSYILFAIISPSAPDIRPRFLDWWRLSDIDHWHMLGRMLTMVIKRIQVNYDVLAKDPFCHGTINNELVKTGWQICCVNESVALFKTVFLGFFVSAH